MEGLKQDIKGYRGEVYEEEISDMLKAELGKFGLGDELSEYLTKKKMNPENLRKEAEFLKKCTEFGCHPEVAVSMLENGIEPDAAEAELIRSMLLDHQFPDFIVPLVLKGQLNPDETYEVAEKAASLRENFGTSVFVEDDDGLTMYDKVLRQFIDEILVNKRIRKVDAVCSKKHSVR
jgi:hypothetical protein